MIDFDKPVRTISDGDARPSYPVEIFRAWTNTQGKLVAIGLIYTPRVDGKKGVDPTPTVFEADGTAGIGYKLENFDPEAAPYVPRSLRVTEPGRVFQTKGGAVALLVGHGTNELDWELRADDRVSYLTTDPAGIPLPPYPEGRAKDDLTVCEVPKVSFRFVRIYDKPKTSKNPTQCSNWYEFDTLAEAQANLQGVRSIATITITEGENLP